MNHSRMRPSEPDPRKGKERIVTVESTAAFLRQATRCAPPIAATAFLVVACASTERPISPYSREARRLLAENPITPSRDELEGCEFLGTRYAGPGIGVEREQQLVLQAGAVLGATHVVWEDQETAHFYRCSDRAAGEGDNV